MIGLIIVAEAAVLLLFSLLVVGLLKSHAEILLRLHELGAGSGEEFSRPVRVDRAVTGATGAPAHDLAGQTPRGEVVAVAVVGAAHDTLLAFLSSGCLTCAGIWEALGASGDLGLPARTRVVAVTKGPEDESASVVWRLAPAGRTAVMSTQAWLDYEVPGSPYFVHVSGSSGRVVAEATAATWEQVVSLVGRADDDGLATKTDARVQGDGARRARIDRELIAAGILPGDPQLYPTSLPVSEGEQ